MTTHEIATAVDRLTARIEHMTVVVERQESLLRVQMDVNRALEARITALEASRILRASA